MGLPLSRYFQLQLNGSRQCRNVRATWLRASHEVMTASDYLFIYSYHISLVDSPKPFKVAIPESSTPDELEDNELQIITNKLSSTHLEM
jgi:hypothetical protein